LKLFVNANTAISEKFYGFHHKYGDGKKVRLFSIKFITSRVQNGFTREALFGAEQVQRAHLVVYSCLKYLVPKSLICEIRKPLKKRF